MIDEKYQDMATTNNEKKLRSKDWCDLATLQGLFKFSNTYLN